MAPTEIKHSVSGQSDKGKDIPLVLVTGASGYIALHIVRLLLNEGYGVRGTVRSVSNEKKLKPLREVCPEGSRHLLDFVEADLTKDEGWSEAVSNCDYVLHVASPFPNTQPKTEEELLKPAVEGTMRVIKACAEEMLKSGRKLKRVVLTSSMAAVHGETTVDKDLYTEDDWSNPESKYLDAYPKSKTLAEKAAWDFLKQLPENQRFELSVINPTVVFGPILSNEAATSVEIVLRAMSVLTMPLVPRVNLPICDVRDVALAHLKAMTLPEAAGQRHIIVSDHLWMGDITKILYEEFSEFGYKVPLWPSPYLAMWFYSFMDKPTRLVLHRVGKVYTFANERMKSVLGIEPRQPKQIILETAHDLIQRGIIQRTKKYVPPNTDTKL